MASSSKGKSNSYYGYSAGLSTLYFSKKITAIFKLKYIDKYFNENDHIFDKRRQEKTSSAFLMLNFNNLSNSKKHIRHFTIRNFKQILKYCILQRREIVCRLYSGIQILKFEAPENRHTSYFTFNLFFDKIFSVKISV